MLKTCELSLLHPAISDYVVLRGVDEQKNELFHRVLIKYAYF